MSEEERAPYDELAKQDRDRYNQECAERDQEILRQQEERRKKNEVGEVLESSKRTSTQAASDASQVAAMEVKKSKVYSAEEIRAKERREEEKRVENENIKKQKDEIKDSKAAQAEARLKFLLNQSDIFSHFGSSKTMANAINEKAASSSSRSVPGSVSKRSRESKNE